MPFFKPDVEEEGGRPKRRHQQGDINLILSTILLLLELFLFLFIFLFFYFFMVIKVLVLKITFETQGDGSQL
jgi:hypothetical protein